MLGSERGAHTSHSNLELKSCQHLWGTLATHVRILSNNDLSHKALYILKYYAVSYVQRTRGT